jgi:hypothetical protein
MNRQIIDDIFKNLGTSGVRKLALALSEDHNNRQVAEDFELSLWQVRAMNQFLPYFIHELILRENSCRQQAVILDFFAKKSAI